MRGLNLKLGSFEESIAISAFNRNQNIQFMTTLSIINAIIHVGNGIISAVSGSSGQSGDGFQKTLTALRDLMLPGEKEEKEKKAARALKILEQEVNKGPLYVRSQKRSKKSQGRVVRKPKGGTDGSKL